MPKVFKVAKSGLGYNASTDTNPDHFALFVDQLVDYILIKEKLVGSQSVASGGAGSNVAHGLSYVPHCLVFAEVSSGVWRKLFSAPISGYGLWYEVNATNLVLKNTSGSAINFAYHIFYDNVT